MSNCPNKCDHSIFPRSSPVKGTRMLRCGRSASFCLFHKGRVMLTTRGRRTAGGKVWRGDALLWREALRLWRGGLGLWSHGLRLWRPSFLLLCDSVVLWCDSVVLWRDIRSVPRPLHRVPRDAPLAPRPPVFCSSAAKIFKENPRNIR